MLQREAAEYFWVKKESRKHEIADFTHLNYINYQLKYIEPMFKLLQICCSTDTSAKGEKEENLGVIFFFEITNVWRQRTYLHKKLKNKRLPQKIHLNLNLLKPQDNDGQFVIILLSMLRKDPKLLTWKVTGVYREGCESSHIERLGIEVSLKINWEWKINFGKIKRVVKGSLRINVTPQNKKGKWSLRIDNEVQ